jgi:hypothetical protein
LRASKPSISASRRNTRNDLISRIHRASDSPIGSDRFPNRNHPFHRDELVFDRRQIERLHRLADARMNIAALDEPELPPEIFHRLRTSHSFIKNMNHTEHWDVA